MGYGKFTLMWLMYAGLTVISYSVFDFFVKKTSGKVDDFLGTLIINLMAVVPALIMVAYLKLTGKEMAVSGEGMKYAVLAGLSVGLASITFLKMFSQGAGLALGAPVVRVGMVVGAVVLGSLVLRETLSVRQMLGVTLGVFGIILIMLK